MSASKSAVACVVSMLLLDVVSAASMRVPVAVPDPLNALLSDPIAKAKYVTAVNAACADFSDGFEGVPPQVLHVTSGGYAVRVSAHTVNHRSTRTQHRATLGRSARKPQRQAHQGLGRRAAVGRNAPHVAVG